MSFLQIVQNAFFSQNPKEQKEAEAQLIEMRQTNPQQFFTLSAAELANEQNSAIIRQAAGTLIKGSARLTNQQGVFLWLCLDQQTKQNIKNSLLNTLIAKELLPQKAAADSISTICTIELPRNEWNDLIPNIAHNTGNQQVEIRRAAIMTLGFICEKLKGEKGFTLDNQTLENVIMGICFGMKKEEQNLEIKLMAAKTLRDAIGFMETYLEKEEVRNYIVGLIIENISLDNKDIKIASLQTLIEFCKYNYTRLDKYIQVFYNATSLPINNDDQEICIPAVEVWNSLATEYVDRQEKQKELTKKINAQQHFSNANYIVQVQQQLLPLLLQNLLKNSNDELESESDIQEVCKRCLCSCVQALGDPIINLFTTFISNTISNQSWQYRQAAVIAFYALLDCPNIQQVNQLIFAANSEFAKLLNDPNSKVKDSAALLLSKIAENYADCLLNHPNILNDMQLILQALSNKPAISRNVCWIICFLSEKLKFNKQCILLQHSDTIIDFLIKNAFRSDLLQQNLNVIDVSFMAIMNMLHFCQNNAIAYKYLRILIDYFKQSYQIQDFRRQSIQAGILAALHASLLCLHDNFQDLNQAQEVYSLIIDHFKQLGDVNSDGLYVISALATCTRSNFSNFLEDFWQYLTFALSKQEDVDLFKSAIFTLGDVARACENSFANHINVVESLLKCLEQQTFDRELKLHVFTCLGDIILGCKSHCFGYFDQLMKIFELAFQAAVELQQNQPDQDTLEYVDQLQEQLVDAYTCMLHGLNDKFDEKQKNANEAFLPQFPKLIEFLRRTCDQSLNPTIDYLRNSLTLICDIAQYYKLKVQDIVNTKFTYDLIEILKRFIHVEENRQIIEYAEKTLLSLK